MIYLGVQETGVLTWLCLSTKFFENKLLHVFVYFPTCFWRIQNNKSLKTSILSLRKPTSLPFFSYFLSSCFYFTVFTSRITLIPQIICLTICKSNMGFTNKCGSTQHPLINLLPSHSPVSKMSQEGPREQHPQPEVCPKKVDPQKLIDS